ncbi:MAG: hypothetical protein ACHP84_00660 [Caulobacterales bacterium]|jgi:hypothetical protein
MTQFRPGDEPPNGREAEAQRQETIMPWIWGGLGLLVVIGFVAWLATGNPPSKPAQPVVAPAEQSGSPARSPTAP